MLVFVDQSGLSNPSDPSSHTVLAALCMPEDQHEHLAKFLFQQRLQAFGQNILSKEAKAKRQLTRRTFERAEQGKEGAKKQALFLCRIFEDYLEPAHAHVFAIIMKRPIQKRTHSWLHLPVEYVRLLERVVLLTEKDEPDGKAIMVFDDMIFTADNAELSKRISHFLFTDEPRGKPMAEHLLDAALFVGSHLTPGIQVADVIAGCIRQYYEYELDSSSGIQFDSYLLRLKQFYAIAKAKTHDFYDSATDRTTYGFYILP